MLHVARMPGLPARSGVRGEHGTRRHHPPKALAHVFPARCGHDDQRHGSLRSCANGAYAGNPCVRVADASSPVSSPLEGTPDSTKCQAVPPAATLQARQPGPGPLESAVSPLSLNCIAPPSPGFRLSRRVPLPLLRAYFQSRPNKRMLTSQRQEPKAMRYAILGFVLLLGGCLEAIDLAEERLASPRMCEVPNGIVRCASSGTQPSR